MELSLRDAFEIAPDVMFRELDNEAVILNLESGVYFGLDEVGTRMWRLIEEHRQLQTVFEIMCSEYEVSPEALERDLLALAGELFANGLVRVIAL